MDNILMFSKVFFSILVSIDFTHTKLRKQGEVREKDEVNG